LDVLNRLARIYQCRATDLMDGEDHSASDPAVSSTADLAVSRLPLVCEPSAEPGDVVARVDAFIASSGSVLVNRESDYQHLVTELTEWACRMKRRDILQWLSWAAAAAAAAPVLQGLDVDERDRVATALASPRRVDDNVIDHIENVLWRCMRQDDALGPQAALDTTLAQRCLVRALLPEAPAAHQDRLLSLYANLSRFAGWLSFDLNNYDAAADYYDTARAAAHEAHNTELGAFVLCNMSHLETWRGRPRIGIDHAVAAQGWANQTDDGRLQAYAADVAARAFAADQQGQPALRAIEQAKRSLGDATNVPVSDSHVYFYNAGQLATAESICYLRLGQTERATVTAQVAMDTIDSSFVRNVAMAALLLGTCQLASAKPQIDQAAHALSTAGRLAAHNRSARLTHRLHSSVRALEPWQDNEAVQTVRAELAVYQVVE
jgi:tetratricopeptide (TPR) repeat protein